ncbi:hypothetical protein QFZ79_003514 [Arthrobacter sp. V4I6]|nr:hypothetical protein [Arthrobacter sp. V4I6]
MPPLRRERPGSSPPRWPIWKPNPPGNCGRPLWWGDRAQDVAGAAANGLECIGVGWGFALDGELDEAGAVEIVQTTTALHETILRRDAAGTVAGLTPARAAAAMAYVARTEARTEVYTDANV